MTGSELVAVPDFSLLHDFCHGLLGAIIDWAPWRTLQCAVSGFRADISESIVNSSPGQSTSPSTSGPRLTTAYMKALMI